jgi:hypothetical protein
MINRLEKAVSHLGNRLFILFITHGSMYRVRKNQASGIEPM